MGFRDFLFRSQRVDVDPRVDQFSTRSVPDGARNDGGRFTLPYEMRRLATEADGQLALVLTFLRVADPLSMNAESIGNIDDRIHLRGLANDFHSAPEIVRARELL